MIDDDQHKISPPNLVCVVFGHKLRKHDWYHRRDDILGWSRLCQCVRCAYSMTETVRSRDRPAPESLKYSAGNIRGKD
jgi:hypothetical protein